MRTVEVVEHCLNRGLVRNGIAEDAVIEACLEALQDLGGGDEVHICNPEWENITAFVFIPLKASVAVAVWAGIEIVKRISHVVEKINAVVASCKSF